MAVNYSLAVWGGTAGKAVTSIDTSTNRITITSHGCSVYGTPIAFTAGTLPTVAGTALALNTTYYGKWVTNNAFELYYDSALSSIVDFTGSGSGLTLKSAYYVGLSSTARWVAVYDGIKSWITGRSAAIATDSEILEVADQCYEYITASANITVPSGYNEITSIVNGVRSAAFHGGQPGRGFIIKTTGTLSSGAVIKLQRYGDLVDGITLQSESSFGVSALGWVAAAGACFQRCIAIGYSTSQAYGFYLDGQLGRLLYNIAISCQYGFYPVTFKSGSIVANNIAAKNGTGFYRAANVSGYWYNNISIGNTTNWTGTSAAMEGAANNAGLSGEAWYTGTDTRVTIATTDFLDYANNDFRAATTSSPQVDAGTEYYVTASGPAPVTDIDDLEVPYYNGGGAEARDVGPHEKEMGYGPRPADLYQSVTVSGAVAGTRIQIYDTTSSTELYNGTPTFPYAWTDSANPTADRAIRLRATYVSGATSKTMIEADIGTCGQTEGTEAVSYVCNQEDDEVYNGNAIDGSSVADVEIDDATDRVRINVSSGAITWPDIYAYQVYWLNTEDGIRDDFAFIIAPSQADYLFENFMVKNITSPTVPLTITGGFARDKDSGTIVDIIDTTGGFVFPLVDHVVFLGVGDALSGAQNSKLMGLPEATDNASAVRSELTTELGRLDVAVSTRLASASYAAAPSASAVSAQVLADAQATPLHADIRKVNGGAIDGTGSETDPWGPA